MTSPAVSEDGGMVLDDVDRQIGRGTVGCCGRVWFFLLEFSVWFVGLAVRDRCNCDKIDSGRGMRLRVVML